MTYLPIIEKIKILFDLIMDFKLVGIFIILLLIATILLSLKKISSKKYIIFLLISFTLLFGISIFMNYKTLASTFDNFTTLFFMNIYFPSIYIYILTLLVGFIAFIISSFNVMIKRAYKIINTSMFIINNILLVIVLDIIAKNKIDIFSVNSLYTNTSLVVALESSMVIFIGWVLAIIIAFVTDCICDRFAHKKVYVNSTTESYDNSYSNIEIDDTTVKALDEENDSKKAYTYTYEDKDTNLNTTFNDYVQEYDINLEDTKIDSTLANDTMTQDKENTLVSDTKKDSPSVVVDLLSSNVPVTYYDSKEVEQEYNLANPQEMYENKYTEDTSLKDNRVSLNNAFTFEKKELPKENHASYTIEDYRKALDMLKAIKNYSIRNNINIDDALAISMISNYSIEDCLKFRNILKSNLN